MLIHSVYFWLKDELGDEKKKSFLEGLLKLKEIPTIVDLYVGIPADTPKRQVLDDSYTFGIVVVFQDLDGHNKYQIHPIHQEFLKNYSSYWERIVVYDIEE